VVTIYSPTVHSQTLAGSQIVNLKSMLEISIMLKWMQFH